MQSQSTPTSTNAELSRTIIYDVCPTCGRFGPLSRYSEDGSEFDELDEHWMCEACGTPTAYGPEDGAPF